MSELLWRQKTDSTCKNMGKRSSLVKYIQSMPSPVRKISSFFRCLIKSCEMCTSKGPGRLGPLPVRVTSSGRAMVRVRRQQLTILHYLIMAEQGDVAFILETWTESTEGVCCLPALHISRSSSPRDLMAGKVVLRYSTEMGSFSPVGRFGQSSNPLALNIFI